MGLQVVECDDASDALARAGAYLKTRPVEHNLLLTILDQGIEHALDGSFWIVIDGSEVIGFALESPPGMGAVLAPMPANACRLLAETITIPLRRAVGEAATAAAFAGRWTETNSIGARDVEPQRLYELTNLRSAASAPGELRVARTDDRDTLIAWSRAFVEELELVSEDTEALVDRRIADEQFWIWDNDGAVSMASASRPVAGVTRVQYVYTPPDRRGSGYATACVEHMSRVLVARGLRCVLYTDLGEATPNSIYRAIGYEAVAEILGYKFI